MSKLYVPYRVSVQELLSTSLSWMLTTHRYWGHAIILGQPALAPWTRDFLIYWIQVCFEGMYHSKKKSTLVHSNTYTWLMNNVCLATVSVHRHLACRGKLISFQLWITTLLCSTMTSLNSGLVTKTHTSHGKNFAIATEMYQLFHYSSTYLHVCDVCIRPLEHVCYKYLESMIGAVQFLWSAYLVTNRLLEVPEVPGSCRRLQWLQRCWQIGWVQIQMSSDHGSCWYVLLQTFRWNWVWLSLRLDK